MFLNPFLEGVILIALGVGIIILDKMYGAGVHDTGVTVIGIGLGYIGKTAVEKAQ